MTASMTAARSPAAEAFVPELPRIAVDRAHEIAPFLKVIEPMMAAAYDRLTADLEELAAGHETSSAAPVDAALAEILFENIPGRLAMLLRRTLVLELNVARLSGKLEGESPRERFQSFVALLGRAEYQRQIWDEYPVLAARLELRLEQWRASSRELVRRLRDDWPELCRHFWPAETPPERLVEAKSGVGDSHRGGRSVVILRFSDGRSLVYKPRSLAVERRFNDLLHWANAKGCGPALRTLTVLEREGYGWVEFVAPQPCADRAAIGRFYERQGAYLALLYVLNASDFHFENIIAAGEHPVLVDLETLFNPRLTDGTGAAEPATLIELLRRSALGPGLLPNRFRANPEKEEGVDLSGLSPVTGQETWKPVLAIENAGTDEMRFGYRLGSFPETHHHPVLEGAAGAAAEISAADHAAEISRGFERCYRLLLEHRAELLRDGGPIAAFAAAEVRVIFRATLSYALLQAESFHPDLLRDEADRERLFDRLERTVADQPHMARLITAERFDLHRVDVPIFTTCPASKDLWTSRGERLENLFAESGLEMVEQTLARLGEDDLERQGWLVRATLGTLAHSRGAGRGPVPASVSAALEGPAARSEELLHGADAVARQLKRMAWCESGAASWFTFKLLSGRHWNVQPAPPDLYDGLSGIAFFLAYHGRVAGDEGSTELARHAITTLRHDLEVSPDLLPMIGALNGWGGLIHLYVHLAELWSEPSWLDEAEGIVAGLTDQRIDQERLHDVVAGSAGCLATLLELYERRPTGAVLAAAVRCGEHLLAGARPKGSGCGWVVDEAGSTPLAGFSHGAAGIAWALFRLAALTGDVRYRRAALGAIAYEREVFSSAEGNWPDLRAGERPEEAGGPGAGGHHFLTAWCHGAPGVVLGRLLSRPHFADEGSHREIVVGLETLRRSGFDKSDCLCHGTLGNLDVLLVASEVLDDAALRRETYRRASCLMARAAEEGWRYGVPGGMEPPGLLTGLAGFGYQLLRLAEPERVPSILALASPPRIRDGRL